MIPNDSGFLLPVSLFAEAWPAFPKSQTFSNITWYYRSRNADINARQLL